jgi:hypothetical protein
MRLGTLGLVSSLSISFFAIQSKSQTPPPSGNTMGQAESSISAQAPINAILDSSIDSKKAKQGDAVKAHVAEAVKAPDNSTVLPKGAKLVGHITRSSARSKGDPESTLGIQFDKAELKGQQEKPLSGMIVEAVAAPSETPTSFGGGANGAPSSGGGTATNNPSMSGSRGTRQDTGTPQSGQRSTYPTAGTGAEEPNATGSLPPNARGVYGIEGMSLARNPSSGEIVITSKGKNVRLDSGTRLLLVPGQQGSAAPAQ